MPKSEELPKIWESVDSYITELLVSSDPILDSAVKKSNAAGLPQHQVSPTQGKMLMLLAQIKGARNILEIGTLGGYSTIWLARALPHCGKLITLEINPKYAEVAHENIRNANLSKLVDIRLGKALDTLPKLISEKQHFDLIFIDADKENNSEYFKYALKLSHNGTLLIFDNVIRSGSVIDSESKDPSVQGVRRLNELLSKEKRVSSTVIQTVGSKGYDGFAMVLVNSD